MVNLKYIVFFILQNLNRQADKVQINTMQDVTGKVSLGHILYLLIFIIVRGPHCHELWAPARLGNVCFPAKCLSLNEPHGGLGLVQGTFSAS